MTQFATETIKQSLHQQILQKSEEYIGQGNFTGSVVSVWRGKPGEYPSAVTAVAGTHDVPSNNEAKLVNSESFFDLASLTKPFTAVLAVAMSEKLGIDLHTPLAELKALEGLFGNQDLKDTPLGRITLAQLLTHSAGLPSTVGRDVVNAWATNERSPDEIKAEIVAIANNELIARDNNLENKNQVVESMLPHPEATAEVLYSDLGYMFLGIVLEKLGTYYIGEGNSKSLYALMTHFVLEPLKINEKIVLGNGPQSKDRNPNLNEQAVRSALERDKRFNVPPGQPHDNKAFWLDCIAGHAGLFGTAEGVMIFIRYFDSLVNDHRLKLMLQSCIAWGSKKDSQSKGQTDAVLSSNMRTYGFLTPPGDSDSGVASIAGDVDYLIYHPGFTGTFMCRFVHPETDEIVSVTILTNATLCEQSGVAPDNDKFRQDILRLVYEAAA